MDMDSSIPKRCSDVAYLIVLILLQKIEKNKYKKIGCPLCNQKYYLTWQPSFFIIFLFIYQQSVFSKLFQKYSTIFLISWNWGCSDLDCSICFDIYPIYIYEANFSKYEIESR